jgi:lipopolysaccharide export LptBFGC system permease protein LptF
MKAWLIALLIVLGLALLIIIIYFVSSLIITPPIEEAKYNCIEDSYNCADFETQEEAQKVFDECGGKNKDIHRLDNDGDGVVCEGLG